MQWAENGWSSNMIFGDWSSAISAKEHNFCDIVFAILHKKIF